MKKLSHDQFFKEVFGLKVVALDYLTHFCPPEILDGIELGTLRRAETAFTSQTLSSFFADIRYECDRSGGGPPAQVSFLFEHKSANDPETYFQLLRYLLEVWDLQKKDNRERTPIVPIIVYHGEAAWAHEALKSPFPGLTGHVAGFVPQFRYHLTDLSAISDEELQQSGSSLLQSVFLTMKHIWDSAYLQQNFWVLLRGLASHIDATGRNLLTVLLVYITTQGNLKRPKLDEIMTQMPQELAPEAFSIIDYFMEKGLEKGREEGREEGIEEGMEKGMEKGIRHSILQLHKKGFAPEQIADLLSFPLEKVREAID